MLETWKLRLEVESEIRSKWRESISIQWNSNDYLDRFLQKYDNQMPIEITTWTYSSVKQSFRQNLKESPTNPSPDEYRVMMKSPTSLWQS